jgi:hypothetical protein
MNAVAGSGMASMSLASIEPSIPGSTLSRRTCPESLLENLLMVNSAESARAEMLPGPEGVHKLHVDHLRPGKILLRQIQYLFGCAHVMGSRAYASKPAETPRRSGFVADNFARAAPRTFRYSRRGNSGATG